MSDKVKPLKTPASTGGDFETVPSGVFLARCYKMIDLGTAPARIVGGKKFKAARKIMLFWELLQTQKGKDVFMEDGERVFSINAEYTWSMYKTANLRKVLDLWRGQPFTDAEADGFEISKLLGVYGYLQVVHEKKGDRTYANVGAIMPSDQYDIGVNDLSTFSIEDPDMEMFEGFPEWLRNKIEDSAEWEKPKIKPRKITEAGEIEIEDVEDEEDQGGIPEKELKKLPF